MFGSSGISGNTPRTSIIRMDADDIDNTRAHNVVNEIATCMGATVTVSHDAVGNMTDDGSAYEYVYDPFGRLRDSNRMA
jgi:YD repeat-containing protein